MFLQNVCLHSVLVLFWQACQPSYIHLFSRGEKDALVNWKHVHNIFNVIDFKKMFLFSRFDLEFVLSAPTSEWNGKRGYLSPALLSGFLKRSLNTSKVLICICGPMPFTEQGMK